MRRSPTALALALAFPACAPPQPAQVPSPSPAVIVPEVRAEVKQTGTRLRITARVPCIEQASVEAPPPSPSASTQTWTYSYHRPDPLSLGIGIGFLGLSIPGFVLAPVVEKNSGLAIGYGVGLAALGALTITLAFVLPGLKPQAVPPPPSAAPSRSYLRCPSGYRSLSVELRPGGAESIDLGETNAEGVLEVDLTQVGPPGFGGAASAPIYVDGREVGTADLADAASAAPECPAACEKRCPGAEDCARACRERWCR